MSNATPDPAAHDRERSRRRRRFWLILAAVTLLIAAITAGVTALLVNIFEHKQEARNPFYRVVDLTDETVDPAIWGKNFPLQYDGYRRTVDQVRTRYGGSEAVPHTPTNADPRSIVAQSRLEEDPRLKTMWAGYAFSVDFREERGHAYMLVDQETTERQHFAKQPGTCLHCHASVYVPYKRAGGGDLIKGFEKMNQMPFAEARKLVTHPVACIDCHEPTTMQLRVTRPGFIEGIRANKAGAGVKDYDVNRDATRQEMRSYVCGQCHVEYYFKGPEKRLVYPWADGLKVENILLEPTMGDLADAGADAGRNAAGQVRLPDGGLFDGGTGPGYNEILVSLAIVPVDDPHAKTLIQQTRFHEARYPLGGVKSPPDGILYVDQKRLTDFCPRPDGGTDGGP
jgi:nitrite reductase (cytochrome c-552)